MARGFNPILDGSSHLLTPEKAVEIQEALGSDIAMVLDECIPHDAARELRARVDGADDSLGRALLECAQLSRSS